MVSTDLKTDTVKVVFCRNPFDSTDRIITEIESGLTFREIYNSFAHHYDIDYAQIIDTDEIVTDYDTYPKTSEVYIRIFPAGGDTKKLGLAEGLVGAALVIGGVILMMTPATAPLGVAMVGTGVGLLLSGFVMYNTNVPNLSDLDTTKTTYSIKGAKNEVRLGSRIPFILGKHLIVPDTCAKPFTYNGYEIVDGSVQTPQYVRQLFCCGYKDVTLSESTLKVGNTRFTSEYFDCSYEVLNGVTSVGTIYPKISKQTSVSALLEYHDEVIKTTPTNTKSVDIDISFPSGLLQYDSDGDSKSESVTFYVHYRTNVNGVKGEWKAISPEYDKFGYGWWLITGKYKETYRQTIQYDFDNLTESGDDYCSTRQYDIRVYRETEDRNQSKHIDKMYWEYLKCYTGLFKDGAIDARPISSAMQSQLALIATEVKASDNANGMLDELNIEGQLKAPVWNGLGSGSAYWISSSTGTSNPAVCFLYVIRNDYIVKKKATDDQIDWPAFEAWFTFCNTKGFECNNYIAFDISLEELLNGIVSTGRAMWTIRDGKYTILIEKEQSYAVQFFTPRNTFNFSATKIFADLPAALRMKFIDASGGYVQAERIVYYDSADYDLYGDNPPSTLKVDDVTLFGVTSADQAWKIGRYQLACAYLRSEIYTFSADMEHLVCSRGDRVKINHDVPMLGLFAFRVVAVYESLGLVQSIDVDEYILFEPAKSYSIVVRLNDGTSITKGLINPCSGTNVETKELYFSTPFSISTNNIEADNLGMFGESNLETADLVITDIVANDDLSATITAVEYNEAIYTADTGDIPEYINRIDEPGDASNAIVLGVPVDPNIASAENTRIIGETDVSSTAISTSKVPTRILRTTADAVYPYPIDTQYLHYTDTDDMAVYSKENNNTSAGTLVQASAYVVCLGFYVSLLDGFLYDFADHQITSIQVYSPVLSLVNSVSFVCPDDMKVYIVDAVTSFPGTHAAVTSYPLVNPNICYIENGEIVVVDNGSISGSGVFCLITINALDGTYGRTLLTNPIVENIINMDYYSSGIILFTTADFNTYKLPTDGVSSHTLYNINTLQIGCINGLSYFVDSINNYLYGQNGNEANAIYEVKPIMRKSTAAVTISATLTSGSEILTGISAEDIAKLEINDILIHANIPEGSSIESIHDNDVIITNPVTVSGTATIEVQSRRIFFEAQDIITPGSVGVAQLNISEIIENGSNSNGSYIKFADGTLIQLCTISVTHTTVGNTNIGTYGWSNYFGIGVFSLPTDFYDTTYRIVANSITYIGFNMVQVTSLNTYTIYFVSVTSGTSSINVIAIGRWKA